MEVPRWRETCSLVIDVMEAVVVEPRVVNSVEQSITSPVLAVDLDGTLVRMDLLLESLLALLKHQPLCVFLLPLWLPKGKPYFKQQIARRVSAQHGPGNRLRYANRTAGRRSLEAFRIGPNPNGSGW